MHTMKLNKERTKVRKFYACLSSNKAVHSFLLGSLSHASLQTSAETTAAMETRAQFLLTVCIVRAWRFTVASVDVRRWADVIDWARRAGPGGRADGAALNTAEELQQQIPGPGLCWRNGPPALCWAIKWCQAETFRTNGWRTLICCDNLVMWAVTLTAVCPTFASHLWVSVSAGGLLCCCWCYWWWRSGYAHLYLSDGCCLSDNDNDAFSSSCLLLMPAALTPHLCVSSSRGLTQDLGYVANLVARKL